MNLTGTPQLSDNKVRLHFLCGKIASGKSTLAKQLAKQPRTVLLSEDEWLSTLYPNEVTELTHYIAKSTLVKKVLEKHIKQLMDAGNTVVMDFPANTPNQRQWLKSLAQLSNVPYVFHVLQVDNDECKARLAARNLTGKNPFHTSDTQFDLITAHFSYPAPDEQLNCQFYPE
ncbi:AAA family ATPase [Providencia sp. PROV259]|uniref:AAA family ATPase n=1 Tax=Providencia sp. PROV259 TaxID=2949947 RepID=UPI00234AC101|nr:ATP-binding protein [Providencia sp. PROV259]